jgi:hypothetical protein
VEAKRSDENSQGWPGSPGKTKKATVTDRAPALPDKTLQRQPEIRYTASIIGGFPKKDKDLRTTQCTAVPENGARAQQVKPRNSVIADVIGLAFRSARRQMVFSILLLHSNYFAITMRSEECAHATEKLYDS